MLKNTTLLGYNSVYGRVGYVTLSREDPTGLVSPNHVTPTQRQQDKQIASLPPNIKRIGWGNRPSEAYMEQCVLERSTPMNLACNMGKLEDDPEVTRVFNKKLHRKWGSYPVDIVTEFTYMQGSNGHWDAVE